MSVKFEFSRHVSKKPEIRILMKICPAGTEPHRNEYQKYFLGVKAAGA
jgi:hypothetical protein